MTHPTKIAIACDHAGFEYKEALKAHFAGKAEIIDLGAGSADSVDYPDFGKAMGQAISDGKAEKGIVICGSGIGISIAANRFPKVRAALCITPEMAKLARQHNDANVLALGSRLMSLEAAKECADVFFSTEFEGGRHEGRVKKLDFC